MTLRSKQHGTTGDGPVHADADTVLEVMTERHCKRAFLDRQVPREDLRRVIRAAAHAPSSRNTQSWRVEILAGDARNRLSRRLCDTFDAGIAPAPDYVNRPAEMSPSHAERARRAGAELFAAKGIARDDLLARRLHDRDNLRFYGAPVAMIFHVPGNAEAGTFLDMGMFVQNIMLGLVSFGLGSCPQYSVAGYGFIIREQLELASDRVVVCGLAVGYPDRDAPVNRFYPARAPLEEYSNWRD